MREDKKMPKKKQFVPSASGRSPRGSYRYGGRPKVIEDRITPSVAMERAEWEWLQEHAKAQGTTAGQLMRTLMQDYRKGVEENRG